MGGVLRPQYCRVERWRGYVSSTFFVRFPDGALVESRRFRWRRSEPPPPNRVAARVAYDEVVSRVAAAGWQRHADGDSWFETEFVRLVEVPAEPEPLEPEPVRPRPVVIAPPVSSQPPLPVQAAPVPPPPDEPRRYLAATVVTVAVLATAAVAAVVVHRGVGGGHATRATAAAPQRRVHRTAKLATATKQIQSVAVQPMVDLRIAANSNGSWFELRRGSAAGAVLYSATLEPGHSVHYRAPRIWARFGAASNLTITVNGRRVALQGTFDKVFVPNG